MSAPTYAAIDLRGLAAAYKGGLAAASEVFRLRALVVASCERARRDFHTLAAMPLFCEVGLTYFWVDGAPFDGSLSEIHGYRITYRTECPRCGSPKHQACSVPLGGYRPPDLVPQWASETREREEARMITERARLAPIPQAQPPAVDPPDAADLSEFARTHQEHLRLVRAGFTVLDWDALRQLKADWERDSRPSPKARERERGRHAVG